MKYRIPVTITAEIITDVDDEDIPEDVAGELLSELVEYCCGDLVVKEAVYGEVTDA